jgi:Family of unknown function (DUF6174)
MNMPGLAAAVLVAGFLGSEASTREEPAVALARAEAQWQAMSPKDYRFEIILTCECSPQGMTFRVIGGKAELPRGADAMSQRFHDRYGTMEKLFAVIRRALAARGHRVVVKYDRQLGYPIWADLDPRRDVIDDEVFFRVMGFRKLATPTWVGLPSRRQQAR